MKPLYRSKNTSIYLGDVLEVLRSFEDESFDLIFADPPYNLSNGGFTCHAGRQVSVNKGKWDKSKGFERDAAFHAEWIDACKRVLKKNGSIWISGTYHSIYACAFALQKGGWHLINDVCWYKPNASPNLSCRMFTASHESLIWAKKSKSAKHVFNYTAMRNGDWPNDFLKRPAKQMRSVWAIGTPRPDEKTFGRHPTQKPLALMERIIVSSSRPGDTVLDPFCGSATTGVAALRHKRKFVGIDTSRGYLKRFAVPRLKETERITK